MSKIWFWIVVSIIWASGVAGIIALTKAGISDPDLRFVMNVVLGFSWGWLVGSIGGALYFERY